MFNYENIKEFVKNHNGMITAKEFKENNIGFFYINKLIDDNIIERVDNGIYNKVEDFEDNYFILQQKYSNIIFSYNIALYFLGKTEVIPNRIDITVPNGYNAHRISHKVVIHYVPREYLKLGAVEETTPFGNKIICYNLERTICDLVKNNNSGLETEQVNKIIRNAFLGKQINLNLLMDYATKLKCDKKIKNMTEVLYWYDK